MKKEPEEQEKIISIEALDKKGNKLCFAENVGKRFPNDSRSFQYCGIAVQVVRRYTKQTSYLSQCIFKSLEN